MSLELGHRLPPPRQPGLLKVVGFSDDDHGRQDHEYWIAVGGASQGYCDAEAPAVCLVTVGLSPGRGIELRMSHVVALELASTIIASVRGWQ